MVCHYGISLAFFYHGDRYKRSLIKQPEESSTVFLFHFPVTVIPRVSSMLNPLVQRYIPVPHPACYGRSEALRQPSAQRIVFECHFLSVRSYHLCQRTVSVPPVFPVFLLSVEPSSRTDVSFCQISVLVILAVPLSVLFHGSSLQEAAYGAVWVGVEVSHAVALSPLFRSVSVLGIFQLSVRSVPVPCRSTSTVFRCEQSVSLTPAVAAHMACLRILSRACVHEATNVVVSETSHYASGQHTFYFKAQCVVTVLRLPRHFTVPATVSGQEL